MNMDCKFNLQPMSDIDPVDLRMSSRQWELQGLTPSGKALDHVSMYGTELSDEENAENMYKMFVNLPAEVITQRVLMIHGDFSKFFRADEYGLQPMSDIDPVDLRMSSRQWELQGLTP